MPASKRVIKLKEALGVSLPMSDVQNLLKRLPVAATMSLTWRGEDSLYFLRSKRWCFGMGWGGDVHFKQHTSGPPWWSRG